MGARTILLLLAATLAVSACDRTRRVLYDGEFFRPVSAKVGDDRRDFAVRVRPATGSVRGAGEAALHEGARYCIENFGRSDIEWAVDLVRNPGAAPIEGDRRVFAGRCLR